jgi:hypothetical protein
MAPSPPARAGGTFAIPSIVCYTTILTGKPANPALYMDLDLEAIKARLEQLRTEHRDLDEAIARIGEKVPYNHLQVQRLKKRKLVLKDLITKLESHLVPDIIA